MKPTNNKNIDIKKKMTGKRPLLMYGAIALAVLMATVAAVQIAPEGSEDSDAADVVYSIDLNSTDFVTGVTWYGNTLFFTVDSIDNIYEVTQSTNTRLAKNIIFNEGVSTTVSIKDIKITGDITLVGDASVDMYLSGTNDISGSVLVGPDASIVIDRNNSPGHSGGSLTVTATNEENAAIGGWYGNNGGYITIYGGTVTATGGGDAAGIGGGSEADGGNIMITGGTVTATGGNGSGGAGIGGGYNGAGGNIIIAGGTVTAIGGSIEGHAQGGAGIGGGFYGAGGNIGIAGATVTAIGGNGAAGIGGGASGGGAALAIGNEADIKAYSKGELPAIHASSVTQHSSTNFNYFVNCALNSALPSGASALLIYANGNTATVLGTLSVPAGYKGFAFLFPDATTANNYNIYLQGDMRKVLRDHDDRPIIPSISGLSGYNAYNSSANNGVLPVKLDTVIFVAVTEITDVPLSADAGTDLILEGTVVPSGATNKAITWTVKSAGDTGATIGGNTLTTTGVGSVTVTATINDGTALGTPFTKDFTITVEASSGAFVPVTDITGVPSWTNAGTDLTLTGTAVPSGATNKAITWTVENAGTTGAEIDGNTLSVTDAGTVVVTATVNNGKAAGTPFTKDFTITVGAVGEEQPESGGSGSNTILLVVAIVVVVVLAVAALFFLHRKGMI